MTLAELEQWMLVRNWGELRRARLEEHLQDYLLLGFDRDLCRWWATVRVASRRAGRSIEVADAWVAATALMYDIPLVTHNPSDYAGVPNLTLLTASS
jgi:tRNA(fMet)-specific endonuclease VapC